MSPFRIGLVALLSLVPVALRAQLADRPVFVEVRVPKPPAIATGREGAFLVYELHVTNFEPRDLTLTRIEVLDAGSGASLATLADSALWREIARPGMGPPPALPDRPRLGGGQRAVTYLYIPLGSGAPPAALRHRLTLTDSAGSRSLEAREVPVAPDVAVIGPPLKGGNWLAGNGPSSGSGHRRALIPLDGRPAIAQRFAIDYVMIDSTGRTFTGDRAKNENFYAEGVEAIAVADGIVVAVKDSIPENVPGLTSRAVPITLETVGGNHVILDLGSGRFAFYAHLKPGSLRVKVGDRVHQGATLGLVGNSGNSTEPHLHFHLADWNSPLGAEGIPYVHETLEYMGRCRSLMGGCTTSPAETKHRVMPLQNEIVRFPK